MARKPVTSTQTPVLEKKNGRGRVKGYKLPENYYTRGPAIGLSFASFKDRLIHWSETKTVEQIEAFVTDPKRWKPLPMIDALCAKQLWRAWQDSGEDFNRVLDRLIGKPPQAITGDDGKPLIPATDLNEIARRTCFLLSLAVANPGAPILDVVPVTIEQQK